MGKKKGELKVVPKKKETVRQEIARLKLENAQLKTELTELNQATVQA